MKKKFNLDGPDGLSCYWHDLRTKQQVRLSRNFVGGTLMVWAGFAMEGKTNLAIITTRMKSKDYTDLLQDNLLPFSEAVMNGDMIFQQDNAAPHVSRHSRMWFEDKGIELLPWPACSPDLNPIENLWGIIARKVYAHNRQYTTLQELEVAVKNAWREIQGETLDNLINTMPSRVCEVIMQAGGKTHY